jgi:CxxC-x17-CxxC domain-containing protein
MVRASFIGDHCEDVVSGFHPIELSCATCGADFVVPVAEQAFRRERGLQDPVDCPECRSRSRAVRNADLIALYEKVGSYTLVETAGAVSGRTGNGRERNGSRGNPMRQRYTTVCDACGAETTVPFIPRGDRPIYCRDCFNARKGQ